MKSFNLADIFNEQLQTPSKMVYKSKPAFRPSSLGSPCLRKIFYSYNRVTEDFEFPLNVKRICKLGDSIHEMLSSSFRASGILVDYKNKDGSAPKSKHHPGELDFEFPIKDEDLEVSAKIDAILLHENKIWIGEYKSINDRGFASLKAPKPDHLIQGTLYYYLFKKALNEGKFNHIKQLDGKTEIAGVKFLYVNKNNSEMKEFTCQANDELFVQIVQKMQIVKQHCESNTLPPKASDWCQSCSWRIKCKTEQLGK